MAGSGADLQIALVAMFFCLAYTYVYAKIAGGRNAANSEDIHE
jgi:hypothetical protein